MATKVDIWNMALASLSVALKIQSESETSVARNQCVAFYDNTLKRVLREFPWQFAKTTVSLAEVTNNNPLWGRAYQYPVDCVFARRIASALRRDNEDSVIPFEVGMYGGARRVYTDVTPATLEYTAFVENVALMPEDFRLVLALELAILIAPSVGGSAADEKRKEALALLGPAWTKAKVSDLGEGRRDPQPESQYTRARR